MQLPKLPTPTPAIKAKLGDFAKTVLLPGDPKRAQFIAENYLTDAHLVNNVRNAHGYTGKYKGKDISVMASGMGIPSIALYSYELFNAYDVDNIIRIGTVGSIQKFINVNDIIVATGCSTNSNYGKGFGLNGTISAVASFDLLMKCDQAKEKLGLKNVHFGPIMTGDVFYTEDKDYDKKWEKMGIYGCEMEGYGLYLNAMRAGKKALCICTVSIDELTGKSVIEEQGHTGFDDMIKLALETAVSL